MVRGEFGVLVIFHYIVVLGRAFEKQSVLHSFVVLPYGVLLVFSSVGEPFQQTFPVIPSLNYLHLVPVVLAADTVEASLLGKAYLPTLLLGAYQQGLGVFVLVGWLFILFGVGFALFGGDLESLRLEEIPSDVGCDEVIY